MKRPNLFTDAGKKRSPIGDDPELRAQADKATQPIVDLQNRVHEFLEFKEDGEDGETGQEYLDKVLTNLKAPKFAIATSIMYDVVRGAGLDPIKFQVTKAEDAQAILLLVYRYLDEYEELRGKENIDDAS